MTDRVITNKRDLRTLPFGRYVVIGKAAHELTQQQINILLRGKPKMNHSHSVHTPDWQWPERWIGTRCLLSEKPNKRGSMPKGWPNA